MWGRRKPEPKPTTNTLLAMAAKPQEQPQDGTDSKTTSKAVPDSTRDNANSDPLYDDPWRSHAATPSPRKRRKMAALEQKKEKEKEKEKSWFDLVYDYTQNTTVHGIRYITDKESYCVRRLIWTAVFLLCLTYVSIQINQQVKYYLSDPLMVKVEVNFNKTLQFPAVAICNQNAFRVTEAVRLGYTDILETIYRRNSTPLTEGDFRAHPKSKTGVNKMYRDLAHRKEDMIVSCDWDSQSCGPENFTVEYTDHGVCFLFNVDPNRTLTAWKTGEEAGLHLTINVEQYEYMKGPHSSSGLRLMLYDRGDYPVVNELGYGVASGTHAFIGAEVLVMERLRTPNGPCRSDRDLETFSIYSDQACKIECLTRHVYKQCGCRAHYMPNMKEAPKVCSIQDYLLCVIKEKDKLERSSENGKFCEECVPSCRSIIYSPNFSYLSAADHDIDNVLEIADTNNLLERYVTARDANSAVDRVQYREDWDYIDSVLQKVDDINDFLGQNLSRILMRNLHRASHLHQTITEIRGNISEIHDFQNFVVAKNFYMAAAELDKRTLSAITTGTDYLWKFEHNLLYLESLRNDYTHRAIRSLLYNMMKNELATRRNMTATALEKLDQIHQAYKKGEAIFKDIFPGRTDEEHLLIVPKRLLLQTVLDVEADATLQDMTHQLENLKGYYSIFEDILDKTFQNNIFDRHGFVRARNKHHGTIEVLNIMRSIVKDDIFFSPVKKLTEKWSDMKRLYTRLETHIKGITQDLKRLNATVAGKEKVAELMEASVNLSRQYVTGDGWRYIGKSKVCGYITSSLAQERVFEVQNFFKRLISRTRQVNDGWNSSYQHFVELAKKVVHDKDTIHYFLNTNSSNKFVNAIDERIDKEGFQNFTDALEEVISRTQRQGDLSILFGTKFQVLAKAFERNKARCETYLERNKLDDNFYRKNFLAIDIYFSELSYELIQQLEAYNIFALLSDIGGSLGLFIGASAISLVELVDLFLFNYYKKRSKQKEEELSKSEKNATMA